MRSNVHTLDVGAFQLGATMGSSPHILDSIVIPLVKGPKILDVGCGFGRWGVLLTTNYWETSGNPKGQPHLVGCDGYQPNVELARKAGFYREVIHSVFPPIPFPDHSFDSVLLIDVLSTSKKKRAGSSLLKPKG